MDSPNWRQPRAPSTSPPRNNSYKPTEVTQTCYPWTQGTCTRPSCDYAHFFFPKLLHRSHRGGSKTKSCYHHDGSRFPLCLWAEDTCGFAHQVPDEEELKGKQEEVRACVEKQGWTEVLTLRCKEVGCGFSFVVKDEWSVDEMVEHCREHGEKEVGGSGEGGGREGGGGGNLPGQQRQVDETGSQAFAMGGMGQGGKKAAMDAPWRKS